MEEYLKELIAKLKEVEKQGISKLWTSDMIQRLEYCLKLNNENESKTTIKTT